MVPVEQTQMDLRPEVLPHSSEMPGVRADPAPCVEQGIRVYGVGNDPGATIRRIQTATNRARAFFTNRPFGAYVETAEKQIGG